MLPPKTNLSRIIERVEAREEVIVPLTRRVNRASVRSLVGQFDLSRRYWIALRRATPMR
jgi:hypothetical protein